LNPDSADGGGGKELRIVWVPFVASTMAPTPVVDLDNMDYHNEEGIRVKHGRSKAANVIHSGEFARRYAASGIVSLVW
jgi:hypothetical protein